MNRAVILINERPSFLTVRVLLRRNDIFFVFFARWRIKLIVSKGWTEDYY